MFVCVCVFVCLWMCVYVCVCVVPYEAESGGQINEARIWKSLEIFYSLEFQSRMTKIKRTTKFYRQIDKKQINEKQIILSYTWKSFGDLLFFGISKPNDLLFKKFSFQSRRGRGGKNEMRMRNELTKLISSLTPSPHS